MKAIGNYTSCCRASSRSYRDVIIPGIFYEIVDYKEVIHISHVLYGIKLILQSVGDLLCRNRISLLKSLHTQLCEILIGSKSVRNLKLRNLLLAKHYLNITSLGYLMGVLQSLPGIWEQTVHFFL